MDVIKIKFIWNEIEFLSAGYTIASCNPWVHRFLSYIVAPLHVSISSRLFVVVVWTLHIALQTIPSIVIKAPVKNLVQDKFIIFHHSHLYD